MYTYNTTLYNIESIHKTILLKAFVEYININRIKVFERISMATGDLTRSAIPPPLWMLWWLSMSGLPPINEWTWMTWQWKEKQNSLDSHIPDNKSDKALLFPISAVYELWLFNKWHLIPIRLRIIVLYTTTKCLMYC